MTFDENTDSMMSHINVGTGTDVTISKLAKTVQDLVEFKGELVFAAQSQRGHLENLWMLVFFQILAGMPACR